MTRSGNSIAARAARMHATASYIGKGIIPGQGGGLPETFFPVANRVNVPNESGGASNTILFGTTPHPLLADVPNKMIRIKCWNGRRSTGLGSEAGGGREVGSGGTMASRAKITYYDPILDQFVTIPMTEYLTGAVQPVTADNGLVDYCAFINAKAGDYIWPCIAAQFASPTGMVFAQNLADIDNGGAFQSGNAFLNGSNSLETMLATTNTNSYAGGRQTFPPVTIRSENDLMSYALVGDKHDEVHPSTADDRPRCSSTVTSPN